MDVEILQQPDSAIAKVSLENSESVYAQAGAMIAMSADLRVATTLRRGKGGGLLGGLKRLVAGESLFLSEFSAPPNGGEIYLAPKLLGDLVAYEFSGQPLIVQSGSYVACGSGVNIDVGFQGFKSIFSGESLFWLELSGQGTALINSFGGIYVIDVAGEYIVDTGHIVAFERSLDFQITKPPGSSWIGAFLGGEGLVCRFQGHGKLYCQTHNNNAFGQLIGSRLPPRN
ncbi:MAG: TIGR00266 family protein [Cyanobacteria bacterium J06641_5]